MTDVRFITVDGEGEFAIVPIALWNSLVAKAEGVAVAGPVEAVPTIPSRVRDDVLDGVHPLKAWRRHRRMTTAQLATAADVSASFVTLIETGKRSASPQVLDRLASALDAPVASLENRTARPENASRCKTCGRESNRC
ncbi:helix-turn-helix domain-containing protein [Paraburkholderia flagellata]|uniref:helix-turn-helix domain-containing protein n=1 Tax=Paraburkholderia flagellata TaxID=2883241 RepID=UPI003570F35B